MQAPHVLALLSMAHATAHTRARVARVAGVARVRRVAGPATGARGHALSPPRGRAPPRRSPDAARDRRPTRDEALARPAWDRCTRRLAVQRWLGATAAASAAAGAAAPAVAAGSYDAPDLNEVSGLVVLRVAQVADFQEKLLREVAKGSDLGVPVTPQQFMFGTELLLQNSNLDGNIKLMIREEVPRDRRDEALKRAPQTMNALLAISGAAARIADAGRFQLTPDDARELAELYRNFRRELFFLFATLPQDAQKRYSGYADALLAYEKDLTRDCKGGAAGGCLKEDDEPAPPAKGSPKAGQAPRDLAKALEAADARGDLESAAAPEAPPAWVPPAAKPARGSFAAMAAGY